MTSSIHDMLNEVSTSLTALWLQVRAEARSGLGSRNKTAEHVLLPVMQRLYSAPGMINTNELGPNFPGVDLYDETSGLGVQVTSDTSSRKIRKTIRTLSRSDLEIDRLVFALVADTKPSYREQTRQGWAELAQGNFEFDPDRDVLAFDDLLTRIQNLPEPEIAAISTELRRLVEGKHRIHLLPHLRAQVEAQMAEEKRVARYIPDVFVETQTTKYQGRCFAHPALFLHRIASWFDRDPFSGLNRLAEMSGVPPVTSPPIQSLTAAANPEEASVAASEFLEELEPLKGTLEAYREINRPRGTGVPRDPALSYVFDQTKYYIELNAGGMQYRLRQRGIELDCVVARIFLLTGPAGQGKTNFLCDFAERFLLRHQIPCAYVTARQLGRVPNRDLADVVCEAIFPDAVEDLVEGLEILEAACAERRVPFVLLIDGLNEHPDVRGFAGQLEHLLERLVSYPHVRVAMTCRSEFLEERFGSLLAGPLQPVLHLSERHGEGFDDDQFEELVRRYFRFFSVRSDLVAPHVLDFLQQDVLLLRLFCEAYGARGKEDAYTQPFVAGIYRGEIFGRYMEEKLGRADVTVEGGRSAPRPLVRRAETRRVLSLIAEHMLDSGQFSDVPRSVVPSELDEELTALLDEELILRRDLGSAPSLLAQRVEVLNFTFDEMRDFILAQHILSIHGSDPGAFVRVIEDQEPSQAQSVEGLQRFLFYASREPENSGFLDDYSRHPWYEAVYDTEIFGVPPAHLTEDDERVVAQALADGGDRAVGFARRLAVRWDSSAYPILNLQLLLRVTREQDAPWFASVIEAVFGNRPYRQQSLGERFCVFVRDHVIPELSRQDRDQYASLFDLLVVLLPVQATPMLDSSAVETFRALIKEQPDCAVEVLQRGLETAEDPHRPFIWRLLGEVSSHIDAVEPLRDEARGDADRAEPDSHLCAEAQRFLARVPSRGDDS